MKKISLLALTVSTTSALSLVLSVKPAAAIGFCPTVGVATSCNVLITVNNTGTTIQSDPNLSPYDGSDDTLVGVINNTSSALVSLPLTSNATNGGIFGFDRDGICSPSYRYNCPGGTFISSLGYVAYGPTGYEGPNNTYSFTSGTSGSVNFTTAIQPGGQTFFGLESTPTGSGIVAGPPVVTPPASVVPEPSSVLSTIGLGVLGAGYVLKRKFKQNKSA